jgi:hypothetical protein
VLRSLLACVGLGTLLAAFPAGAQTEGDYLYDVRMVRAAPGEWLELMDLMQAADVIHREAGDEPPFRLRHSQGDHWDFMLIHPMEDQVVHFAPERVARRARAWESERGRDLAARLEAATAWTEEWFARSVPVEEMRRRFQGMGFFHVEMFAGLPGRRAELVEQRRMENRFYEELGRPLNLIFVRDSGPNWDAMTIGLYESLQAYATAGDGVTVDAEEGAARTAGFDGVAGISPLLRSLLSYHHDTLAVSFR